MSTDFQAGYDSMARAIAHLGDLGERDEMAAAIARVLESVLVLNCPAARQGVAAALADRLEREVADGLQATGDLLGSHLPRRPRGIGNALAGYATDLPRRPRGIGNALAGYAEES